MEADQPTGVSRRAFLSALGAAAGGGAVLGAIGAIGLDRQNTNVAATGAATDLEPFQTPSPSDFTLQGRTNEQTVLVIGAGIAGLCCAYELGKAGYRVTVVDAADRIGGRNWTARSGTSYTDTSGFTQICDFAGGRWLNTGPARIAEHHTTLEYCRELQVPIEVFVNANTDAYVESGGTVRRRRSATADLDGYISELLAKCISQDALDQELTESDRQALIEHLRLIGALGRADRGYVQAPGVDAGTVDTPDPLSTVLDLQLGQRLAFERDWHQAMPMFHPTGGMDSIVDALAAEVGSGRIQLASPATGFDETPSGVRATFGGSRTLEADWGICCIQPGLAATIVNPWPQAVNRALRESVPVPAAKIGLEYDHRFWETDDRVFGGATTTHPDVRVLWYPSTDYLADGGVIVGAYPIGAPAQRFVGLSHDEREALAVDRGQAIHGERYRTDLRSSFSVDWNGVQHIQAAWTAWPQRGAGYRTLQQPAGRWLFAGDWLSHAPGWQHGAFESARRAVNTLHDLALTE